MTTRRERLEAKLAKRADWAQARNAEAERRFARVNSIIEHIPLGQPILVGHHSERHARADQQRITNGMRAGIDAADKAQHHEQKAAGLESQLARNIYSDDEDAPDRLRDRIAALKAKRDKMKASNNAYRKGPAAWAAHLNVSAEREAELRAAVESGYSWCQQPHPSYELTNLGGNIRRLEKRLDEVAAMAARTERAAAAGVLVEGGDYVTVTFPEKPAGDVLQALRAAGFRWARGSWHGTRKSLPSTILAQD